MRAKTPITLDIINENQDKFIKFSMLTKQDIKEIFFQPGDVDIADLDGMEYDWRLPLYAKIIFRLVQNDSQICGMYWGLDPINQKILRCSCKIYDDLAGGVEFFAWIKNSFGLCELLEVEGTLEKADLKKGWESSKLYHSWKDNVVKYFYGLNSTQQMKLIEKFNWANRYCPEHCPKTTSS